MHIPRWEYVKVELKIDAYPQLDQNIPISLNGNICISPDGIICISPDQMGIYAYPPMEIYV